MQSSIQSYRIHGTQKSDSKVWQSEHYSSFQIAFLAAWDMIQQGEFIYLSVISEPLRMQIVTFTDTVCLVRESDRPFCEERL